MIPATHPLSRVRAELEQIAVAGDHRQLAELLHGERLPSLGGHEEPAELVHRAIIAQPYKPELVIQLAPLLGEVLKEQATAILGSDLAKVRSTDLRNGLLLAELLPRSAAIFSGVLALHEALPGYATTIGQPEDREDLGGRLREALRWQQSDDRLENFWFGLLASRNRVDLLDGLRGILWLPMSSSETEEGQVARIERGLRDFATAALGSEDPSALFQWAVRTLDETRPRSLSYWQHHFSRPASRWPDEFLRAFKNRWPNFKTGTDSPQSKFASGHPPLEGYEVETPNLLNFYLKSPLVILREDSFPPAKDESTPRVKVSKIQGAAHSDYLRSLSEWEFAELELLRDSADHFEILPAPDGIVRDVSSPYILEIPEFLSGNLLNSRVDSRHTEKLIQFLSASLYQAKVLIVFLISSSYPEATASVRSGKEKRWRFGSEQHGRDEFIELLHSKIPLRESAIFSGKSSKMLLGSKVGEKYLHRRLELARRHADLALAHENDELNILAAQLGITAEELLLYLSHLEVRRHRSRNLIGLL
jgi:hypothetical protein